MAWAGGTTAVSAASVALLSAWAHSIDPVARNGGSTLYGLAFVGVALVVAATLGQWTALAVASARRIDVGRRLRRTEAALAAALFVIMLAVTIATAVWWGSMAASAPWVLDETAPGTHPLAVAAFLVAAMAFMGAGSALAAYGVTRMVGGHAGLRTV